jgi:beta-carotene hydroxylase
MPMHEAAHKNIWGKALRGRWVEEAIGTLSSIPTGINFSSHRAGHMRHHAYTNDPKRDPDHFTDGRLSELPVKFYGMTMLYSFLPFFALVPPLRILLPKSLQAVFNERGGNAKEGKAQIRFWLLTTIVLIASFITGHGVEALLLWWLPTRLQLCWLITLRMKLLAIGTLELLSFAVQVCSSAVMTITPCTTCSLAFRITS